MLLFLLLVLDRVCYTVASPLGKAVLHLAEMALYFVYCLQLFWSPLTSAGVIRVRAGCASWAGRVRLQ
jgi:hypothetical protein